MTIQNISARPGNTIVINSDYHSSDRSLNRSSGYFSSDELRSQGPNTTTSSSDEHSGGLNRTGMSHIRRYRNNDQNVSKLPAHYRLKPTCHKSTDHVDQVHELVHRYYRPATNAAGFHQTIDQIDALYDKLDVQGNDRDHSQSANIYDFSRPSTTTTTINRRKQLAQNPIEYTNRYTSTGFQQVPSPLAYENQPSKRPSADHESAQINRNHRWNSSSLTDLVMTTSIRPSQSLSSSGILADYATPDSISPNSGFGSTQDMLAYQHRLNDQSHMARRHRPLGQHSEPTRYGATQGYLSRQTVISSLPL